jgi:hypothetical protein
MYDFHCWSLCRLSMILRKKESVGCKAQSPNITKYWYQELTAITSKCSRFNSQTCLQLIDMPSSSFCTLWIWLSHVSYFIRSCTASLLLSDLIAISNMCFSSNSSGHHHQSIIPKDQVPCKHRAQFT